MNNDKQPTPEPGMGVTIYCGSDRYPGTIVSVERNGKLIRVSRDRFRMRPREDLSSPQGALYVPAQSGDGVEVYTLRKNGRYHLRGYKSGAHLWCSIGERSVYIDPHF